jgi:hypothetical protein
MKNTIIAIIALLVLLTVSFYGYEFVFKKPLVESPTANEQDDLLRPMMDVKQQYKNGTMTFVGNIDLPTPCHTFTADIAPSNSDNYRIDITTIAHKEGVVCAQVITPREFRVSTPVTSPDTALFTLFVNGIEHTINAFEIPSDANIDDYKLELKG